MRQTKIEKDNLYVEIGSGKGNFIYALAKQNKENAYVAIEMQADVLYRILQKQEQETLPNLMLLHGDAFNLLEYFNPNTINTLYINFADPWPKKRHHKRRLTAPSILKIYKTLLKECGKIMIRTDHMDFFYDSIETLKEGGFKVSYHTDVEPIFNMSEYEEKKRKTGPIYSIEAMKL